MTLNDFGWKPYFANQLELSELDTCQPARVTEVQRDAIIATTGETSHRLHLGGRWFQLDAIERPTVGDWLLIDNAGERIIRLLARSSELSRLAAGGQDQQLIAANVDTLFIVTSCNDEFNASRLERYLALASNSGATAVVVLTKTDLADDPEAFVEQARRVSGHTEVVAVNALDAQSLTGLAPWCMPRSTIALLGSSGVGKSTLLNTLAGSERQATGDIREADAHASTQPPIAHYIGWTVACCCWTFRACERWVWLVRLKALAACSRISMRSPSAADSQTANILLNQGAQFAQRSTAVNWTSGDYATSTS